jgi:hypothetical protein
MEQNEPENWDEARYKELNIYFRIRIEQLLKQDTFLLQQQELGKELHLRDIVLQMNPGDRELWEEFLMLDQQKLQVDIWNHLHGKGTPFKPGTGFNNPEDSTW